MPIDDVQLPRFNLENHPDIKYKYSLFRSPIEPDHEHPSCSRCGKPDSGHSNRHLHDPACLYKFGYRGGPTIIWYDGQFCGFACFIDEWGWIE